MTMWRMSTLWATVVYYVCIAVMAILLAVALTTLVKPVLPNELDAHQQEAASEGRR